MLSVPTMPQKQQNNKGLFDIEKIQRMLPHRYPFLLIDRILDIEKGKSIVALKNVTCNESFFQGHFPKFKVMPGVLIIEGIAQTGGVLLYQCVEQNDPSVRTETGEKGIGFAGTLGAIHYIHVFDGEFDGFGIGQNRRL